MTSHAAPVQDLQPSVQPAARLTRTDWVLIIGLLLLTLFMNINRPLTVDDPPYLAHAFQLLENPAQPYSFTFTEAVWPEHGLLLPSPPLIAASSAVCLALFGDNELALQLWMLPYAFLLYWSSIRLAKPWAGAWAAPVVGSVLAAPIVLPALKLMLDIPTAALVVAAVCLTRDYLSNYSGKWALVAAFAACALAPLAKYSGFSGVAAVLLLAWFYGRPWIGIAMAAVAVFLFLSWEGYVYWVYGVSHLQYQMLARVKPTNVAWLLQSILTITSNAAPLLLAAVACALGFGRAWWLGLALLGLGTQIAHAFVLVPVWFLVVQSCLVWAGVVWVLVKLHKTGCLKPETGPSGQISESNIDRFLVCWLVVEFVMMLVITPFPAYRRLISLLLVAGLLVARCGSRRTPAPDPLAMPTLVLASVVASLLFFHADRAFSQAIVTTLTQARAQVDAMPDDGQKGKLYVFGRWSVPYYAPKVGVEELVLDQTRLEPGDTLLVGVLGMYMPRFNADPAAFELIRTFKPIENYPLDPTRSYGGTDGLQHAIHAAFEMALYRVTRPTVVRASPTREQIVKAILPRPIPPSTATSWAILEFAAKEPDPYKNLFAERIVQWGEPFIRQSLRHPSANGRLWTLGLITQNPATLTPGVLEEIEKLKQDEDPRVRQAAGQFTAEKTSR